MMSSMPTSIPIPFISAMAQLPLSLLSLTPLRMVCNPGGFTGSGYSQYLSGWNYLRLADPGDGLFQIKRILRSDGTELQLGNAWTTDRTFPATGRPIYENRLHLLDYNAAAGSQTYTVTYTLGDSTPPKVREIVDVAPNPRNTPVTSLDVVFTEPIKTSTFDYNDITLTLEGGTNLITSAVTVTQINPPPTGLATWKVLPAMSVNTNSASMPLEFRTLKVLQVPEP
jgi:hypothetical protein